MHYGAVAYTCLTSKSRVKSKCWDTRATDAIIKSGQKDTEASIQTVSLYGDMVLPYNGMF